MNSPMISLNPDGTVDLSVIDYTTEPGPFWYVVVNDTPPMPDRPLPLEHAITAFRREVEQADEDDIVELQQCGDETLAWAGVTPATDADEDDDR